MKNKKIFMPFLFVGFVFLMGFVVMSLWNWLMPEIFDLDSINYWQALGLIILAKIFFGGFKGCGHKNKCCGHRHGGHGHWKHKFKDKWANMPEAEKSKWEEKFGACCTPTSKQEHKENSSEE